ncbi:MAG: hypothetical protein V4608_16850 [Bacteroidota bacterium]
MIKLKALLNNKWFFPALIFYYGTFYILFGEKYPFNGGLSTDGYVFGTFIPDFTKSYFFDSYYVQRILPSFLVSIFFKILSINSVIANIYIAFQILNLLSIVITCYYFKRILLWFKITFKNQLLAFTLLLLNFGVIKYPFYMPVMTDTFAMMLSTILLFCYIKNDIKGMVFTTLMLAFTWPMGYYHGLLLLALPISILPFQKPLKIQKNLIYGGFTIYILFLSLYLVFIKKMDNTVLYVSKIDRNLLFISITGIALLYFFFAKLFFNKTLLDISLFFKKLKYERVLVSLGVFAIVTAIVYFLNPNPTPKYTTVQVLTDPIIYALIKPLISLVADTSYFGVVVCLLMIFWNDFCKIMSQMGWGIAAAIGLNLFLFGITPQSRHLINILPWVIVFLAKALNKYSFSNRFYIVVGLLSFVASKIWLLLNIYHIWPHLTFDRNGCLGFPDQILWMNIGPWMNEQMYYVQGGVMLLIIAILILTLYKIEINKSNKLLQLVRRF